ncbi:extracellular solute-binding protein [Nocardioides sp. B-3]|nr:extracellular solute-binding protein [Nocardioides sp. B-3]UUZ57798.1 extracellular solute-binding protein [Nocardioides sp. B-3]
MAVAGATALIATGCAKASTGGEEANTMTVWTHAGGAEKEIDLLETIISDYNASQDTYTVKLKSFPQEAYNSAVTSAATAKKLPCILDMDAPNVPAWANSGFLTPLDLPQELVDKNLESTKGIYNDELYSIGYFEAALMIFAHKDALDKAGVRIPTVEKPWSADEFATALDKIKETGDYDFPFDLGTGDSGTEWWTYGYSPFLQSFGGDLIDTTASRAPTVSSTVTLRRSGPPGSADSWRTATCRRSPESTLRRLLERQVRDGVDGHLELHRPRRGEGRHRVAAAGLRQRPQDRWRLPAVGRELKLRDEGSRDGLPRVLPRCEIPQQDRRRLRQRTCHRRGCRDDGRLGGRRTEAVLPG